MGTTRPTVKNRLREWAATHPYEVEVTASLVWRHGDLGKRWVHIHPRRNTAEFLDEDHDVKWRGYKNLDDILPEINRWVLQGIL